MSAVPPPSRFSRGDPVLATVPAVVSAVLPVSAAGRRPHRVQVWSPTTAGHVEIDVADESQLAPAPAPGSSP